MIKRGQFNVIILSVFLTVGIPLIKSQFPKNTYKVTAPQVLLKDLGMSSLLVEIENYSNDTVSVKVKMWGAAPVKPEYLVKKGTLWLSIV